MMMLQSGFDNNYSAYLLVYIHNFSTSYYELAEHSIKIAAHQNGLIGFNIKQSSNRTNLVNIIPTIKEWMRII